MMKNKALWMAAAVFLATSAASAEQLAARVDGPIESVSNVVERIEARNDFGAYASVHYNLKTRSYEVRYTAKDGTPRHVVIDARTGKERG